MTFVVYQDSDIQQEMTFSSPILPKQRSFFDCDVSGRSQASRKMTLNKKNCQTNQQLGFLDCQGSNGTNVLNIFKSKNRLEADCFEVKS